VNFNVKLLKIGNLFYYDWSCKLCARQWLSWIQFLHRRNVFCFAMHIVFFIMLHAYPKNILVMLTHTSPCFDKWKCTHQKIVVSLSSYKMKHILFLLHAATEWIKGRQMEEVLTIKNRYYHRTHIFILDVSSSLCSFPTRVVISHPLCLRERWSDTSLT
jgi:hypothetical protein